MMAGCRFTLLIDVAYGDCRWRLNGRIFHYRIHFIEFTLFEASSFHFVICREFIFLYRNCHISHGLIESTKLLQAFSCQMRPLRRFVVPSNITSREDVLFLYRARAWLLLIWLRWYLLPHCHLIFDDTIPAATGHFVEYFIFISASKFLPRFSFRWAGRDESFHFFRRVMREWYATRGVSSGLASMISFHFLSFRW